MLLLDGHDISVYKKYYIVLYKKNQTDYLYHQPAENLVSETP